MPEERHPYDFNPPPFLEDQGWEQMRLLLDEHLPQQPTPGVFRRMFSWQVMAACAAGLLLCLVTPSLLKDTRPMAPEANHAAANTPTSSNSQGGTTLLPGNTINGHTNNNIANTHTGTTNVDVDTGPAMTGKTGPVVLAQSSLSASNQHNHNNQPIDTSVRYHPQQFQAANATNAASTGNETAVTGNNTQASTASAAPAAKQAQLPVTSSPAQSNKNIIWPSFDVPSSHKPAETGHGVNVAVQLNRNVTGNVSQDAQQLYNLPVYPSLTASVDISKKFSLTTGISAFTPGNFGGAPSPNQVQVTSGQYAFSAVSGKETIKQAYSWQIPMTINFAVKKNLTLSAGTSLAFLQKVLVQHDETVYNYAGPSSANSTNSNSESRLLSADALSNTNAGANYTVRRFDPRLLLGAQYQINRFQIGVQYGRAFSPSVVLKNAPDAKGNKNEVFNFSVGYNLFQPKKK